MEKISWWEAWTDDDMSWRERSALNSAAEGIAGLQDNDIHLGQQIAKLHERGRAQAKEIAKLRAAVKVLVQLVGDAGAVDKSVLQYRLEAAFEELEAVDTAAPAEQTVACAGCGTAIPLARTTITPVGNMCDACYAKSPYAT